MTGRQASIVFLGIALLIGVYFAWSSWLEQQKVIRLEELKSVNHVEALKALSFASQQEVKKFDRVLDGLVKQRIDRRASDRDSGQ